MSQYKLYLPFAFLILFTAITTCAAMVITDTAHEVAISETIKKQWNKPNQPVLVPAIAYSRDFAVADWIQEPRGGRALLRQISGQWQTLVCGDAQVKSKHQLIKLGVPLEDAQVIVTSLEKQEAAMTLSDLTTINSYVGMLDLLANPHH